MSSWEDLQSDKALVCHREINSEVGGATVWMVLLSDGFLVECGSSGLSQMRAIRLARIINEAGPDAFSKDNLRAALRHD